MVCERWNSFEDFLEDMGNPPKGMTIDRINVDGNYEKDNCRWVPAQKQASNKGNNRRITFQGTTRTLMEWSRATGIPTSTLWNRLNRGCSPEVAFIKGQLNV